MDEKVVESIVGFSKKGCKVLFGHNASGNLKIKVKHGPMGMLTTRYRLDLDTFNEVKRRLKSQQRV